MIQTEWLGEPMYCIFVLITVFHVSGTRPVLFRGVWGPMNKTCGVHCDTSHHYGNKIFPL